MDAFVSSLFVSDIIFDAMILSRVTKSRTDVGRYIPLDGRDTPTLSRGMSIKEMACKGSRHISAPLNHRAYHSADPKAEYHQLFDVKISR